MELIKMKRVGGLNTHTHTHTPIYQLWNLYEGRTNVVLLSEKGGVKLDNALTHDRL